MKLPQCALELVDKSTGKLFDLPSYKNMQKHLRRWVESSGIKKKITYHCSRHTFATLHITIGNDIYTLSKLMGHSDIRVTQDYAKLIDKLKDDAMVRMDELFRARSDLL